MEPLTLVVLAAGRSTRFGRPKQLEPVGPNGECLLELTMDQAFAAGVQAAVVVAAAFFTLYNLLFRFNVSHAAQLIGMRMKLPVGWVEWLLASLVWFLLIGNTVAIAVGAMLAFAPVPMARLELASARWISTRRFMKVTDTMHDEPDHWVHHSPRAIGAVLTLMATADVAMSVAVASRAGMRSLMPVLRKEVKQCRRGRTARGPDMTHRRLGRPGPGRESDANRIV